MIQGGRWGSYEVSDYHLSRYACYLIVQNADPSKGIVLLWQSYFVSQAARAVNVTPRDFAIFQDHGYKGLYGGETAKDIHARKGLKRGQHILDYMGSTETAANSFRAAMAREMMARDGVSDQTTAHHTHHDAGRLVRDTMMRAGVPLPEELPTPDKSYPQLKREAEERERLELEDRYGLWGYLGASAEDGSQE